MIRTRTIAANGLRFEADEAGEGEDIALLLHGFPEHRISWRHQLPLFAGGDWRAVAPDLRGYGDSSRPKGVDAYRLDRLVEDVEGLFVALNARRRLLVGHDWGGVIAWAAAARPLKLDGLIVLNAPHPAVYRRLASRSLRQLAMSWYVFFFQLPGLPEWLLTRKRAAAVKSAFLRQVKDKSVFPREVIETYCNNALQPGAATAMVNYYRANTGMIWDRSLERCIECPTLLIWGEDDFALDLRLTQGLDEFVKDIELIRLSGVSHWVQQEAPERVNGAIAAWLKAKHLEGAPSATGV